MAPAPAAPSEAEIRLRSLLKELRKAPEEKLTPAIQEEMKRIEIREEDLAAKGMHRAVNDVKKAKKAITAATSARVKLMADWKVFLQQSVTTWREYTTMFQTQEKALQDSLTAAHEALALARRSFEEQSASLKEAGVQEISDDDKENGSLDETMQSETTKRIYEGLTSVVDSLHALSEKAEFEEQQAKRQRRSDDPLDEDANGVPIASLPSLQPFAKAGSV